MNLGLENKLACVCAPTDGIGLACAISLLSEGCKVFICGRNKASVEKTIQSLENTYGKNISGISLDLTKKNSAQLFLDSAKQHFNQQIDIVISNIGGPQSGPSSQFDEDKWQKALNNIFFSSLRLFDASLEHLKNSKNGRFLAITSISALVHLKNMILINTIPFAIHAFIKTLALEHTSDNLTINAIYPGFTKTNRMIELCKAQAVRDNRTFENVLNENQNKLPINRFAQPKEIGDVATFLCSNKASYISGVCLAVDGAFSTIK